MEQSTFTPSNKEYWELLYNHKQICEVLVGEGSLVSKVLFRSKVNHLFQILQTPFSQETAYILLTSLNRSLYNYLLMQLNLSFTECCFNNRAHKHDVSDADALLKAGNRILDAYAACLEESRVNHTHIEKVCGYVQTHLGDDLSLAKVSAEVFLSKSHLCSIFKALTGTTFNSYVRQQRIQRARTLLSSTDQSIDDVSAACGFNSSTYFATVFKSEMGMSPTAFRQEFVHRAEAAQ